MLAAVVAAILVVAPVAADIGGYLEASTEAEFAGEQVVLCETPDGSRSTAFEIAQVDGTVVAWDAQSGDSIVRVAPGLSMTSAGDHVEATLVESSRSAQPSSYTEGEPSSTSYLGRPVTEVGFYREGIARVRLTLADDSGPVLGSRTFDADGDAYCDRRLVPFSTDVTGVPSLATGDDLQPATPLETAPAMLPEEAVGLELMDTYPVEDGTLSYYSDGFFSVGVVVTSRPVDLGSDVVEVPAGRGHYRRNFTAGSAVVSWSTGTDNLAVITDLPPDMLEEFLASLPEPVDAGFFRRIWSRFFG